MKVAKERRLQIQARKFWVSGRVQAVGYRAFAAQSAAKIGVTGWVRNLDDGRVEAHANGTAQQLDDFEGLLRRGPRWAEVRGVEVEETPATSTSDFRIR